MSGKLAGSLNKFQHKKDIEKLKNDFNDFKSFFFEQNKVACGEYKVDKNDGAVLGVEKS